MPPFAFDPSAYPATPGCYLMQDASGEVLYVGKAKSLRRRLSSYFQPNQHKRIQRMVARIASIEVILVRNEMEMGENKPSRVLYQKTPLGMYDWHNYGHSPIGARSDVENVDIPRLQAFYHRYYQPDNATLIVSGKFDEEKTLGYIAGSFGKIPKPTRTLPVLYTLDPVQDGERSVVVRRVGGVPMNPATKTLSG